MNNKLFTTLELRARKEGVYIDVQPAGDHGVSVCVSKDKERIVRLASGQTLEEAQEKAEIQALMAFYNMEMPEMAKEEAERKAKEEAEAKTAESDNEKEDIFKASFFKKKGEAEVERKAAEEKAEAERKAKEEAERKAKEEAERKAKEEAERKAKEEAERKAKEEAERKAKEEAERKAKEEAERKAKEKEAKKAELKAMLAKLDEDEEDTPQEQYEVIDTKDVETDDIKTLDEENGLAPDFIWNYGLYKDEGALPFTEICLKDTNFAGAMLGLQLDSENMTPELKPYAAKAQAFLKDRGITRQNAHDVSEYIKRNKLQFRTEDIQKALSA